MERRHDLDWLRVLLFALLVPFHAAIGFTPAAQQVYGIGNPELAPPWLSLLLGLSHQFRLHSLFLISGIGTWFAFRRRGILTFWGERLLRLAVPLIVASLTINMIMGYLLKAVHAPGLSFDVFAREWIVHGGLERIQHLWFLLVLLALSLIAAPGFALVRRFWPEWLGRGLEWLAVRGWGLGLLFLFGLPFAALTLAAKPWHPGKTGEGHLFWLYGLYFLSGFLLMQAGPGLWPVIRRVWPSALVLGLVTGGAYLVVLGGAEETRPGLALLMDQGGWAQTGIPAYSPWFMASMLLDASSSWFLTLAALGLAARFLNRPSRWLGVLNHAVYPFYILHMVFVSAGIIWAARTDLPWGLELLVIILGTYLSCWLGYLVLRRFRLTRFLFGIKPLTRR